MDSNKGPEDEGYMTNDVEREWEMQLDGMKT